jgi:hypothetical protein
MNVYKSLQKAKNLLSTDGDGDVSRYYDVYNYAASAADDDSSKTNDGSNV